MSTCLSGACFIFGAGEYAAGQDGLPRIPVMPSASDIVIAADAGLRTVRRLGIKPKLIIGDFDSLGAVPAADGKEELLRLPVRKDDTDMLAALKEGRRRGCTVFYLYGGTGGRIDHTLANIQCLSWLAASGCRGYLYDGTYMLTAIRNGSLKLPQELPFPLRSGTLSLFAQGGDARGVTIAGLSYTLRDGVLYRDVPTGVSNEYGGGDAEISVRDGTLLAVLSV